MNKQLRDLGSPNQPRCIFGSHSVSAVGRLGALLILASGAQVAGGPSVVAAGARDGGGLDTGSSCFCLEVIHINSSLFHWPEQVTVPGRTLRRQKGPLLPSAQRENQNLNGQRLGPPQGWRCSWATLVVRTEMIQAQPHRSTSFSTFK